MMGRLADILGLLLVSLFILCVWLSTLPILAMPVRVTIEVGLTLPFALWLYVLSTPEIQEHSLLVAYILNLAVVQKMGEFSFAMYGLHMPIGVYLTFAVYGTLDEKPPYWFLLPMLAASVLCSWLFTIVVDKQIQRLITSYFETSPPSAQTASISGPLNEPILAN
jgi:peptidoglycan/LPS O-acetylase OafA/YrhL